MSSYCMKLVSDGIRFFGAFTVIHPYAVPRPPRTLHAIPDRCLRATLIRLIASLRAKNPPSRPQNLGRWLVQPRHKEKVVQRPNHVAHCKCQGTPRRGPAA